MDEEEREYLDIERREVVTGVLVDVEHLQEFRLRIAAAKQEMEDLERGVRRARAAFQAVNGVHLSLEKVLKEMAGQDEAGRAASIVLRAIKVAVDEERQAQIRANSEGAS